MIDEVTGQGFDSCAILWVLFDNWCNMVYGICLCMSKCTVPLRMYSILAFLPPLNCSIAHLSTGCSGTVRYMQVCELWCGTELDHLSHGLFSNSDDVIGRSTGHGCASKVYKFKHGLS